MSIGRDTTFNLIGALAPALFTLAVTPFYLHAINPERFGLLAICWTLVGALGFTSLGMGPSLTYRLALNADDRPAERSRLTWSALWLSLAPSLLGALLVLLIGRFYFTDFASVTSALNREIRAALPLLATAFPLGVISGVLNGALQGRGRFDLLSGTSLFSSALVALLPLGAAVLIGPQLPVLIAASAFGLLLTIAFQFVICRLVIPLQMLAAPTRGDVKALLGYGAWTSGTALIAPLVLLLDRFIIGALRGPAAVAAYVLPYNLVQRLIYVPASLSSALFPRLGPLREEDVRQLQSQSLAWLNGLLTPMSVAAIALAAPFFHFWIGPSLGSAASPVAAILLVGGWVHGIGHVPSTIVSGRNRPDLLTKLLLAYLIPYAALVYVATERWGIVGAATAWTIRAAFDPVLFFFTRPRRSDMRSIAFSAALVLAAMITALGLPWTSPLYWAVVALLVGAACYRHRDILVASIGKVRGVAFGTA